ncbi:hypothetical protein [Roseovarius nanhaiticus]|uniref:Uncharacterized protein n=1 Tax=Roseovarius nanhaiticus TaxID=573024 RepID=A0A1N7HIB9_9RHOB|nr:hypothetical protein [Roseovarius nanhaiticus]SEK93263.1 hypothetical protein SAMN05216208_2214 [Roseovarius nanhaiticus]SIS24471.1 hypothetical protein SAMN05421666_3102 [Roseovarius nanhaiticus]
MQNISGYKGIGLFIDLNLDRFLMPAAIATALFVSAFFASF